jgi:hypothetical protein
MKRVLLFSWLMVGFLSVSAQKTVSFPQSWTGNWKGTMLWYQGNKPAQKVPMELRIQKGDSADTYTWQIIYGKAQEDNRPYLLIPKDTATGHWAIDERNGIVLDQYMIGNRFCGAFTVEKSTIVNNYWIENGELNIEFYSIGAKPIATTGKGNEDAPFVDSYRVGSYQRAVLVKGK